MDTHADHNSIFAQFGVIKLRVQRLPFLSSPSLNNVGLPLLRLFLKSSKEFLSSPRDCLGFASETVLTILD